MRKQHSALLLRHIKMDSVVQTLWEAYMLNAKQICSLNGSSQLKVGALEHWNLPYIPGGPLQSHFQGFIEWNNGKSFGKGLEVIASGSLCCLWQKVIASAEENFWLHLHCSSSFCVFMEIPPLLSVTINEELRNWRQVWYPDFLVVKICKQH